MHPGWSRTPRLTCLLLCLVLRPGAVGPGLAGRAFASDDGTGEAAGLGPELPPELPGREARRSWQEVHGELEFTGGRIVYALHVNPDRPGLYEITHYRITVAGAEAAESEKVLWNSRPGRGPLEAFARAAPGWRRLERGSPEYQHEMGNAMRLYALHRALLLGEGTGPE